MTKSLTRKTFEGSAWIGGASAVRLGLRVISVAILARLLTPSEYGVVAGALLAMDFAKMVYNMGLAPTLIQRAAVRRDHIATAFFCSFFVALLVAVGTWFAAPLVADLMRIPELTQILKVLALLIPVGAFSVLCEALLARSMKAKSLAVRPVAAFTVSTFFVAIPMAAYGFGYWSLVAMQAADMIMSALILGIAARRLLARPAFSRRAFSELWPLSLGFTVNQPFLYVALNADKVLIGRFLGADALGLYTRASFLTTTAAALFTDIARLSVFPAMAQVQGDHDRLRNGLLKLLSLVALLTLTTSAFCITFAEQIIDVLLGAQWGSAVVPFAILSAAFYFRIAQRGLGTLFQALGRPYWLTGVQAFRAAALVAGVWFTRDSGLAAICVVVVLVIASTYAIMVLMAKRAIGISLKSLAAIHLHPLAISAAIIAFDLALTWLFPQLPSLLAPVITLLLLGASSLLAILFDKKWVLGPSGAALFQRAEGRS